jgi:hypothetical protein
MEHSATILNNLWRAPSKAAELVRVGLLGALLATLAACGGSDAVITNNDLAEPASDGVAPVLESVTIKMARDRDPKPNGKAKLEQEIQIDIVASEAIMKPSVSINGVPADEVTGNVRNWRAKRMMTEFDVDGDVTFEITFQDTSGEVGAMVSATTDGSAVQYCIEGCADGDSTLAGDWLLDGDGAAGVGPSAGSTEWWASVEADRPCWYDDVHRFGEDGSFLNIMGDETFVEAWQGGADSCATPVAPHDGSTVGTYTYDEDAGTLTITGKGAHIALPKAVNGQELTTTADTPDSVVYQVLTLDGDSMTVTLETGPGVWWTFRLARVPASPLAGKWKLDGDGAAGVGPSAGSMEWWASVEADRPCWYDDIYDFGADGSFSNVHGDATWVEGWQGGADSCAAPVAPHDGSADAVFTYDEDASTLTLMGKGAYLAVPKAVNGQELSSVADTPDFVTYQVTTLDGDSMSLTVETAAGVWWSFNLKRVSTSPLKGNWKLDGDGAAGVGPSAGSTEWWASVEADRPCWYDDIMHFGADGTFVNAMGGETFVEAWQGGADACATPVAPHDGSTTGSFDYDADAGKLTINGLGSHIALPKAVNGLELSNIADTPESITYDVLTFDGDSMTVTVEAGAGVWWSFRLVRVPEVKLAGKWKLDGDGAAGVGPTAGSMEWWASVEADRPCWYDDIYDFGGDGSFLNVHGDDTWVEVWQGGADSCAAPVAPHDSSADAVYTYNEDAGTLTVLGKGAYVALPKAVNGQELASVADTPDFITYQVLTLDGDSMTVTVETAAGVWWTFNLKRVSNSPLRGNWKLDGDGGAGVGPSAGSTEWWASVEADRPCWYDDIMHFGADGTFLNAMGGETFVEAWQGGADACAAPVAPHDGSTTGSFDYDADAGTLTINGLGSHIALPKAVNGQELSSIADTPESVTYDVLTVGSDSMTVTVEAGAGVFWSFRLKKD